MHYSIRNTLCLSVFISSLLAACGGGGGGGGSSPAPTGSLAIAEVDADHDGLIEIATLEQLDWIRNNWDGTSLIDFKKQSNSKGCPGTGCFGYELVTDLDFDTNADGVIDSLDTYYDYDKNGGSSGWKPIPRLHASLEGNGHHIRNLYINTKIGSPAAGLFEIIYVDNVHDIRIQNIVFDGPATSVTGRGYGGTLAARISNFGKLTISHIAQTGRVTVTRPIVEGDGVASSGWIAGGIIGSLETGAGSTTVIDSNSATSVVESTDSDAGGLIGSIWGFSGNSFTLTNNSSLTQVTGKSAGGFAARFSMSGTPIIFSNNSSSGSVTGTYGDTGGLIGAAGFLKGELVNNHSSATVTGLQNVGGLLGSLECVNGTLIEESFSTGAITSQYSVTNVGNSQTVSGGYIGGLIGSMNVPTEGACGVKSSYASGVISGGIAAGGIIGSITPIVFSSSVSAGTIELTDNFSIASIKGFSRAGGVVGNISIYGGASVIASRNLVLGRIAYESSSGSSGGIAGEVFISSPSQLSLTFNHWDSSNTNTPSISAGPSSATTETGNLATNWLLLACTTDANNFSCANAELFHGWNNSFNSQNQPIWDFGNMSQLPSLRFRGALHRPVFNLGDYSVSIESF